MGPYKVTIPDGREEIVMASDADDAKRIVASWGVFSVGQLKASKVKTGGHRP